jgi:hypothetical protein
MNSYGLRRPIPEEVKREVRRACGYGCVICGLAFIQYDHFNPPFEQARSHEIDGIALLCGACHDKKTKGLLSQATVAGARRRPAALMKGSPRDTLDILPPFTLWLGSSSVRDVSTIVTTLEGEHWLSIEQPEADGAPMRLSAMFFDDHGNPSLEIVGNEWRPVIAQWDTDVEGSCITVRSGPGVIVLELIALPPNALRLTRLRMRRNDLYIDIAPSGLVTMGRAGVEYALDSCSAANADSLFLI